MQNLNQKGQAFSVFKLLIAAIVAVFILTFLLQLLTIIPRPGQGDPAEEASSKIKSLLTKLGTAESTTIVSFAAKGQLRSRTIAEKSGSLSSDDICILVGSSDTGNSIFEGTEGPNATLVHTGNTPIERKLYIMCDNADQINDSIDAIVTAGAQYAEDAFANSGNCNFSGSNRVCIVSIVPAR